MEDAEFRQHIVGALLRQDKRLAEGDKTMALLAEQNRQTMIILTRMDRELLDNTAISRQALATSQRTAKDTAALVELDRGVRRGAKAVVEGATKIERWRKIAMPYFFMVALVTAAWHGLTSGHWPSWKEIVEWATK